MTNIKYTNITRELLEQEYLINKLDIIDISKKYNISYSTIRQYLLKFNIKIRSKGESKRLNLTNKKIGKLTFIKYLYTNKKGHAIWECKCDCGNIIKRISKTIKYNASCGCNTTHTGMQGKNNPLYTGYEEISGKLWSDIKNNAKIRNIPFNLSIEEAWQIYLKQNRKCALTNLNIVFGKNTKENNIGIKTASLDRIDSSKPYSKENCQWVHKDINRIKREYSQTEFIRLCKLVAQNN